MPDVPTGYGGPRERKWYQKEKPDGCEGGFYKDVECAYRLPTCAA